MAGGPHHVIIGQARNEARCLGARHDRQRGKTVHD